MALQKCSGIGVGFIGPNSAGEGTEVLSLSGIKISPPLTGEFVKCELEAVCENSSKVWPSHLPWVGEVELWEEGAESGFVGLGYPLVAAILVGISNVKQRCSLYRKNVRQGKLS